MRLQLQAIDAAGAAHPEPERVHPPAPRGAELVHLAEELHVRIFLVACRLLAAGDVLALVFATLGRGAPQPGTIAFVATAAAFAGAGIARPREVYRRLRSHAALQLAPAAFGALAVFLDGPGSECWWFALPLLWVVATVSSTPLTIAAAIVTGGAWVAGTALGGQPLATASHLGVLPATLSFPAYALIARVLVEGFVGLVLGRHRLACELRDRGHRPVRVRGFADPTAAGSRTPIVPAPATTTPQRARPASRLTARQLEVALLLRDGLRQKEIAACLGISVRQVERLLLAARELVGAATTTQLVAMLASGALSTKRPGGVQPGATTAPGPAGTPAPSPSAA